MEEQWRPDVDQAAVETEMSTRLLEAPDCDRPALYGPINDVIYEMSLARRGTEPLDQTFGADPSFLPLLARLTWPGARVLEVGCGCGYLSLELAKRGRAVTGIDVSSVAIAVARWHAAKLSDCPPDFHRITGTGLPFPDATFDLVFSVEVLEHLHERDVPLHLAEALRVLRPGGRYWVLTPNRLSRLCAHTSDGGGAHRHGEAIASHLKEWTYRELAPLMYATGFRNLRSPGIERFVRSLPPGPAGLKTAAERLARLPLPRRWRAFAWRVAAIIPGCSLVGTKLHGRARQRVLRPQDRERNRVL